MRFIPRVGDSEKITAKNESEAEERFVRGMNAGLAYLSRHQRFRSKRGRTKDEPWSLFLSPDDVVPLICQTGSRYSRFYLSATASFVFERDRREGHEGGVKARVTKYIYVLQADEDPSTELIAWHWHPEQDANLPDPHVHVRVDHDDMPGLRDMHLPSGRVLFEDVLLYAVRDLEVGVQEGTVANLRAQIDKTRKYASW